MSSAPADELQRRVDALTTRLDRGLSKIAAARERGEDVTALEDFWIGLLREYEQAYDAVQAGLAGE